MKNNRNQLTSDIQKAISLFQEFGIRDYAVRPNDSKEGIYLARLARKVARKQGDAYAYEWALQQYNKLIFERNELRNIIHTNRHELKRYEIALKAELNGRPTGYKIG